MAKEIKTRSQRYNQSISQSNENQNIQKEKNTKNTLKSILLKIIILLFIIYFIMRFIGNLGINVKEHSIVSNNIPSSFDGTKIVHFSDIHYGSSINKNKLKKIVQEINNLKPDIVVFTGDLYDEFINITDTMQKEMIEELSKIETKLGKYAVSGNHDYSDTVYESIINNSGFKYLNNTSELIYNGIGNPIELVGYPDARKDTPNYDIPLTDNYKIALIHEPDEIEKLQNHNINLVLAGHSHGGQIRLPFIGKIVTPQGSTKYYDEYYKINDTTLYISYGLGNSMVNLRLFNHPSFNLYRLYTK